MQVGADGVKSRVRQLTGLQSVGWNYSQSAVVAALGLEQVNNFRPCTHGELLLTSIYNRASQKIW